MKSDEGLFRKSTSYEAETIKESTKITWKAEIVSISVLSKVLSLNLLSCPQDREKEKVGDRLEKLNGKRATKS